MAEIKEPKTNADFRKPCRKIDAHMHLPGKGNPQGRSTPEERMVMNDILGIEHCMILPFAEKTIMDVKMPAGSIASTEEAREISRQYPEQFSWYCNLYPEQSQETYQKLKTYKDQGAIGLGEFISLIRLDDPAMEYLFACCQELELPFLFHMSATGKVAGVIDDLGLPLLEKALQKFPKLTFIGHSQPFWYEIAEHKEHVDIRERNLYPAGPVKEGRLSYLLRTYPNLYADLSADSGGNALMRDPDFAISFMTEFQDRLLFGTDTMSKEFIYPLGQWLDSLLHQNKISETVYRKICRENTEKLFHI